MRIIDLRERGMEFPLLSRLTLEVHAAIPEDDDSRHQLFTLLADELDRHRKLGSVAYRPTWLSNVVMEALYKKLPRRTLAGYMAVAMVALDNAGQRMSLENVSKIVSDFAATVDRANFYRWREGEWGIDEKTLVSDQTALKKAFREYRSVAHICAAQVVTSEYFELGHPFETTPEVSEHFLLTAWYYQERLRKAKTFPDWRLWEIVTSPPEDPTGLEVLQPSDALLGWLLGPWLDSQRNEAS